MLTGLGGDGTPPDDLTSNGSTTPTVSSIRSTDRSVENGDNAKLSRKKKVGLNAARLGIFKRVRQLASVKTEELDMLDEDLRNLQIMVEKTESWSQKRSRLQAKIKDIQSEDAGAKTDRLQTEASKLEQEIRQKEEELWALKRRHRRVLDELSDTQNSVEARLSSYKTSLSILDKEVASFLARPPNTNHTSLSSSPFPSLPAKRRTLEMAHEYWQDEYARLAEKCEEVDIDRAALEEGAVMWNDVVTKVADYEMSLQSYMQQAGRNTALDPSPLLDQMDNTITFLDERLDFASSKNWNLLVCAIGAELEAFKQGKELLEETLGTKRKGKEKVTRSLFDDEDLNTETKEDLSISAIRITHSPTKPVQHQHQHQQSSSDDDDPDPELMISHHETDTD